jgi:hypothetical protein
MDKITLFMILVSQVIVVATLIYILTLLKGSADQDKSTGFVDVRFPVPMSNPDETVGAYQERLKRELFEKSVAIKSEIRDGIVVHYDNVKIRFIKSRKINRDPNQMEFEFNRNLKLGDIAT